MLKPKIETQTTYNFKGENYRFSLHWYADDPESIVLTCLEVDRDDRQRGIGTKIMQYAEEFAKEKGFKMIFLKLWSIKRDTWLHHWYMKQGYVFHEDDVFDFWMRKDI
jgi:GNAT superfamily N-acetyltransferase